MSSDINPDLPPRIRCEAISPSILPNAFCDRPHGTVLRYSGSRAASETADDPAHLIGQALGHVRHGDGFTGIVPDSIIRQLQLHAEVGNPACRLLLEWLASRNRDLLASVQPDAGERCSVKPRAGRRLIRERRRAELGSLKKHKSTKAHPSDPKTAIIAAQSEDQGDE